MRAAAGRRHMKTLIHWAGWVACLPLTLLGCVLFLLGFGVPFRMDSDGTLHWRALGFGIHQVIFNRRLAGAYTMGCCVCWPSVAASLYEPGVNHEKRHAWQMRTWMLGACLLFFVVYLGMAGWSLVTSGNIWSRNPVEIDAAAHE